MLTPTTRPRQSIASISSFGKPEGNPLVALPTGTGKALVIAMFIHQTLSMWPGQRFIRNPCKKNLWSKITRNCLNWADRTLRHILSRL